MTLNAKGKTERAHNMQSGNISGCLWGCSENKMNKQRAQTSATEVNHLVLLL